MERTAGFLSEEDEGLLKHTVPEQSKRSSVPVATAGSLREG